MTDYDVHVSASDGSWKVEWTVRTPWVVAKAYFRPTGHLVAELINVEVRDDVADRHRASIIATGVAGGHASRMVMLEGFAHAALAAGRFGGAAGMYVSPLHAADLAGDPYWSREGRRVWDLIGRDRSGPAHDAFFDFATGDLIGLRSGFIGHFDHGVPLPFGRGIGGPTGLSGLGGLDGLGGFGGGLAGLGGHGLFGDGIFGNPSLGPSGALGALFGAPNGLEDMLGGGGPSVGDLRSQLDPVGPLAGGPSEGLSNIITGAGKLIGGAAGAYSGFGIGVTAGMLTGSPGTAAALGMGGLWAGANVGMSAGEAGARVVIGVIQVISNSDTTGAKGGAVEAKADASAAKNEPHMEPVDAETKSHTENDSDGGTSVVVTESKSDGSSNVKVEGDNVRVDNQTDHKVTVETTHSDGSKEEKEVPPHHVDLGYVVDVDMPGAGPRSFGGDLYSLTTPEDERTNGPLPGGPIFYLGDGADGGATGSMMYTTLPEWLDPKVLVINVGENVIRGALDLPI